MSSRVCEQCGREYIPYDRQEIRQRFCTRACSDRWFAAERRAALRAWRLKQQEEALQADGDLSCVETPPRVVAGQR
jgi:hypothetical protein